MCIGTDLGECITGEGLLINFILYVSRGASCFVEPGFVFFCVSIFGLCSGLFVPYILISSTLTVIITSFCACLQPRMEGGLSGGPFTMSNLVVMDLFLYFIFRCVAPMFAIFVPLCAFRMVWVFLICGPKSSYCIWLHVRMQVSVPVPESTLIFSLWQLFVVISLYNLSKYWRLNEYRYSS